MTVATQRRGRTFGSSIAPPFARHVLVFAGAAAAAAALWSMAPPTESPVAWVAAGAVTGAGAGVLSRGVVGVVVVALGLVVGLGVALQATSGGEWPVEELGAATPTLVVALVAALVGYAAVRLILRLRR